MAYTLDDVIDSIMTKDHLVLKAAVDDIMAAKVSDAIEARKEYVGRNMFKPAAEESNDTED